LIENEINVKSLERKLKTFEPGKEYDETEKELVKRKINVESINKVVVIIEEMILKEVEPCKNLN
jgi:hypothetical protein